jgi:hypothetical protein
MLKNTRNHESVLERIFSSRNDYGFLGPMGIFSAFIILGLIGIVRNLLEILFGIFITTKWFSLNPDILFSMFFFPTFLCFFGAFLIHATTGMFATKVPYKDIIYITFCLQMLHLVIPFMDTLNAAFGIPWFWHITDSFMNAYFTNTLNATVGIIFAWIASGVVIFYIFVKRFGVGPLRALLVIFVVFNILYWPIYHIFPSFNTVFDVITGNTFNQFYYRLGSGYYNPGTNFLLTLPDPYNANYFGYGFFFMICSLIGVVYYNKQMKQTRRGKA